MVVYKKASIERVEGKIAVLVLENGQELRLAREELGAFELGSSYVIQVMSEEESTLEQEKLAQNLLNQLLRDEEGDSRKT